MKKLELKFMAAVFAGAFTSSVLAMDLSISAGYTGESTATARVGLQSNFNQAWFETDVGKLAGYWDGAYTYWHGDKGADNHSLSLSPVFRYEFAGESAQPYIEAGIGVAAFQKTRIEGQRLSSSFQFEDRLGAGVRFNNQEVGVRVIHYSNAGIKKPNDGVENYTLHYRFSY